MNAAFLSWQFYNFLSIFALLALMTSFILWGSVYFLSFCKIDINLTFWLNIFLDKNVE